MSIFGQTLRQNILGFADALDSVGTDRQWVLSVMQSHGNELVTLLWRILGNEQDVCDVYQSTFLRLAHLKAGRKPAHVKAYVFRTASNTAISLLRSRASEKKRLIQSTQPDTYHESPEHEVNQRLLIDNMRYYITQLPDHLREVVTLRDLAEMSYSQIARVLGITAGTARVYRCKALTLLSAWMNKNGKRD